MRVPLGYISKLLIVLLFVGASCRSAVCDLACALQVHRAGCHADMPDSTAHAMEMTSADGAVSTSGIAVKQTAFTHPCQQGLCRHLSLSATIGSSTPGLIVDFGEWSVVE